MPNLSSYFKHLYFPQNKLWVEVCIRFSSYLFMYRTAYTSYYYTYCTVSRDQEICQTNQYKSSWHNIPLCVFSSIFFMCWLGDPMDYLIANVVIFFWFTTSSNPRVHQEELSYIALHPVFYSEWLYHISEILTVIAI